MAVLLAAGWSGCASDTSITPPEASAGTSLARATAARTTIAALNDALISGDRAAAARLGTARSQEVLEAAVENVAALGLEDVALRFVEDRSTLAPQDGAGFGPGAWIGTVAVVYRIRGWDQEVTKLETPVTFVPEESGQRIAAIGGIDGRTPLWLTGPLTVLTRGRTLVIARGENAAEYSRMAQQAITDVTKVLPTWDGRLVIEVPATQRQLNEVLNAPQERYANIAAVTAAVDGSLIPSAPVHVFLNPSVFDPLGPRAAQVVISHESAHVATAGTFADVPGWLLEGFADYVALAHAGIPVDTAAAQILAEVAKNGPPSGLPTAEDLAPTAAGLGATYEEAWLANRFIAQLYGESKLVTFYQTVSDGTPTATAFREVLGTTEDAFVKQWRADLRDLASGLSG